MSQESEFSEDLNVGWIQWFCQLDDHQFFCEVDEDFIRQQSNLYGLKKRINKYDDALHMILKKTAPEQEQIQNQKFLEIYQEATQLYGLIHARYITTPMGLAITREKFLAGKYGVCPRVMCQKQHVLPVGISQDLKIARVKVYCPRCDDIYLPKKKFADVDGAFFGTSFAQLLLMTYPDLKPLFKKQLFTPTIFGFKIVQPEKTLKNPEETILKENNILEKEYNEQPINTADTNQRKNKKKKKR